MRALIIKLSALGDIVQTYPVLSYLKKIDPSMEIDWVVDSQNAALVKSHPFVSKALEINAKDWKKHPFSLKTYRDGRTFLKDFRKTHYDVVFDLQGNSKSALITFFAKGKTKVGFGWHSAPEIINCFFTSCHANPPRGQNIRRDYLYIVQNFFHDFSSLPMEKILLKLSQEEEAQLSHFMSQVPHNSWLICPYSIWQSKQIPHHKLKRFLQLADRAFSPYFLFMSGSAKERKMAEKLKEAFPNSIICDRLPLPVVQHIMSRVGLVIGMDSLPLHLAATTDTPTLSFFGPSLSCKYRPFGEEHLSFQGNCPRGSLFEKRCKALRSCKDCPCIHGIDVEGLFTTFSGWWKGRFLSSTNIHENNGVL